MNALSNNKVPISGSERILLEGAIVIGEVNPDEYIEVTVLTRTSSHLHSQLNKIYKVRPSQRHYMAREDFEKIFGASK